MSENKIIGYDGVKLNKKDYGIITSIIKEHYFISRTEERPPEDDFNSCYYIENGEITYLCLKTYTHNKFPKRIVELHNLQELKLVHNRYTLIPESIGNLKNLVRLSLSDNKLEDLPSSIENLQQLKYLDLSYNHFKSIPEVVSTLENLEVLNIENNIVKKIPKNIENLKDLRELYIDDNEFTEIPKEVLSLKNLQKLDLLLSIDKDDDICQELLKRNVEMEGIFWEESSEKWFWVTIGGHIVGTIVFWWFFFFGIIRLMNVIFFTIAGFLLIPLMYYFFNYFRDSKHQKIIVKIVLVGGGGYVFGAITWFITGYLLITAPWAPLQALPPVLRGRIFLLLLPTLCGIAAYIMYRIGKKRDWRPSSYYID